MKYSLIFHTQVETDLTEAYHWYENSLQGLGERFLNELEKCYGDLESHPQYYSCVVKNYRKLALKHFPYIIAFEIVNDKVFVHAVFHTSRNQRKILKRRK